MRKITGYQGPVRYGTERAGDVKHSLADILAARTSLGYEPTVFFEEGLRRTVAWYSEMLAKDPARQVSS